MRGTPRGCSRNPEATLDDLIKHVKGPDFPTGGIIFGADSIRQAYGTGKGSIVVRSVAEIKEDKKDVLRSEIKSVERLRDLAFVR